MIVAACCGLLIASVPFIPATSMPLVRPLFYVTATVAGLLFSFMLFDRKTHVAMRQANIETRRGRPLGGTPQLLDPERGLFGTHAGTPPLLAIRAVLLLELIAAAFLSGKSTSGRDVAELAFAAVFITIELGLLRLPVVAKPNHFVARVSADSRYRLFVNGISVSSVRLEVI